MNFYISKKNNKSGFTFIEISIVLGILGLLAVFITSSFSGLGSRQTLDKATISVISILNEARSTAISSKSASSWGVRVYANKLTSFEGSYGVNNKDYILPSLLSISTSTGIGTDIIFNNVSGNTTASGTIMITVLSDIDKNSIIRIFSTGAIEKN
jgi:prepilin-type N-terminal cleavage/methylation domain-containing protein